MTCNSCLKSLNKAQYSKDGKHKSCPECSTVNGKEHIFYSCDYFGYTDERITSNNPNGIQSWCPPCRGKGHSTRRNGILCSRINE